MKRKRLVVVLLLLFLPIFSAFFFPKKSPFPPFEQCLDPSDVCLDKKKWRRVARVYNRHLASRRAGAKHTIPKRIHQIYLEKSIPSAIAQKQSAWQEAHPDWDYTLWTAEEIGFLYLQNHAKIQTATPKEKIRLLRNEILAQFGGVYIDCRVPCAQKLDPLIERCDFFAYLQKNKRPKLSGKIVGAAPKHPILRRSVRKPETMLTKNFFHEMKKHSSHINVALPQVERLPNEDNPPRRGASPQGTLSP